MLAFVRERNGLEIAYSRYMDIPIRVKPEIEVTAPENPSNNELLLKRWGIMLPYTGVGTYTCCKR
jgi:hypothetical protein